MRWNRDINICARDLLFGNYRYALSEWFLTIDSCTHGITITRTYDENPLMDNNI